jgi:tetratricopeptide (TPR) repeat protein
LAIAREIGDRRGEGNALGNLGLAYYRLGQAERAIGFYEQHLAIAREIGDRRGEGTALGNLVVGYAALGQAERAIGLLEQALQIGQEIKDPQIIRIISRSLERWRGGSGSE